ncbi:MAG: monoheme cytochrome C [Bacteroidia bacterium]|nr:monoheme cytochrome C [Bacteroidia bacterium]NNF31009.1 monoheme cytochrome C [Flavobacteriaceae bacterium]MBT8276859.1 monoheme cytochrome C [Bacteroidia bacterium]NNJ82429.1 monoheme cytochrome C [Flavobacteriaceae bacterium]NNK53077.1 monoheme cytochrome C [Flavobacteriaceae bacterium]
MAREDVFREQVKKVYRLLMLILVFSVLTGGVLVYFTVNPGFLDFNQTTAELVEVPVEVDEDLIENGIHVRTGLVEADGLMEVVNNCTACHSAKIVTQNRMSAERWNATIKWMQETQNLWDLGGNQEIIVNYLVTNYPPSAKGRRMVLTDIEWYELKD